MARTIIACLAVGAVIVGGWYAWKHVSLRGAAAISQTQQSAQVAAATLLAPLWQTYYYPFDIGTRGAPANSGWPEDYHDFYALFAGSNGGDTSQGGYPYLESFVDAFESADPSNHLIGVNKGSAVTWYPNIDGITNDVPYRARPSSITVAAGTPVTVEWACMDGSVTTSAGATTCRNTYCDEIEFLHCVHYHQECSYAPPGKTEFQFYNSSVGTGFLTNGRRVSSTTVVPQKTTQYALTCVGGTYPDGFLEYQKISGVWVLKATHKFKVEDAVMTFTIKVCDPAGNPSPGVFTLLHGRTSSISITVGGVSYDWCLDNPTSQDYLVPAASTVELDAFKARVTDHTLLDDSGHFVSFQ